MISGKCVVICTVFLSHLVADAERHLWDLDVDERVVHGCPLLHLVNVVQCRLREANQYQYHQYLKSSMAATHHISWK